MFPALMGLIIACNDCEGLLYVQGFERVLPISGPLADVVSTVPWDGSEGAPVEEDEFSLEDLMKEEL